MENSRLLILIVALLVPLSAHALEADSDMHSRVTNKVQSDHQADLKTGRVKRAPAATTAAPVHRQAPTAMTAAPHPVQVQELKLKKAAPAKK
jgi:hypothetical protein